VGASLRRSNRRDGLCTAYDAVGVRRRSTQRTEPLQLRLARLEELQVAVDQVIIPNGNSLRISAGLSWSAGRKLEVQLAARPARFGAEGLNAQTVFDSLYRAAADAG